MLDGTAPVFALLHRPEAADPHALEVLLGETTTCATIADLPLSEEPAAGPAGRHELLALVPYRQLAERGFDVHDDGTPLVALRVAEQQTLPLSAALARLPNEPVKVDRGGFDLDDEEYARIVRRVVDEEIGGGEGANFVIKRSFTAWLPGFSAVGALSFFRRLLERETGAYWTFLVHTGDRVLLGATPERHVSVRDGTAVMNPISGTYRYPPGGPTLDGVLSFLTDRKETDELYMVVDEELKMMARICRAGGRLSGPYLKEMARLAHTEYVIRGRTDRDVREVLRETMFAPTVTGSPLENAARVISRHEPSGRGYYSGVAALVGRDAAGARTLDSSILIRTADVSADDRGALGERGVRPQGAHGVPYVVAGDVRRAAEGAGPVRQGNNPLPLFFGHRTFPENRKHLIRMRPRGIDDGKRVDAVVEILGDLLARFLAAYVKNVVPDLERHPEVMAKTLQRLLADVVGVRLEGAHEGGRADQPSRLAGDRRQVVVLAAQRVVELAGLQHLAHAHVGERAGHDRRGVDGGGRLHAAGQQVVARQQGKCVTVLGVRGGPAAAGAGVVDQVVVVERGDVQCLDHRRRVHDPLRCVGRVLLQQVGGEQDQGGPQQAAGLRHRVLDGPGDPAVRRRDQRVESFPDACQVAFQAFLDKRERFV
nr:chorismate-binding protein [Streptomyces alkaliterrae]